MSGGKNVLFLMFNYPNADTNAENLYSDLAKEFSVKGHNVTVMATETRDGFPTTIAVENGVRVIRVKTPPALGVSNFIRKGMAYVAMPYNFRKAYKKHLKKASFDMIFMPTPPITLIDFALYVKKRTKAVLYLILRDIHPQSISSIGLLNNPVLYKFMDMKAQKAYHKVDIIGCMSPGNIEFVKSIAPDIHPGKIVLLPNWQKYQPYTQPDRNLLGKYGLDNKFVVIYGGALGPGQNTSNIAKLASHYRNDTNIVFVVVGKGVGKQSLIDNVKDMCLENVRFLDFMPREDYNSLLASADLGLISLSPDYKVPTCPSKSIGYMSMKIPILAMINRDSDYGPFYIEDIGVGLWAASDDFEGITAKFDHIYNDGEARNGMKERGYEYFVNNLTSECIYTLLMEQVATHADQR